MALETVKKNLVFRPARRRLPQHDDVCVAQHLSMSPKGLPDQALDAVAPGRGGQLPLGRNYTQPRALAVIAAQQNREILIAAGPGLSKYAPVRRLVRQLVFS